MTRHQMTDEQIDSKFFKNKPGRKALEAAAPVAAEVNPQAVTQASQAADQFSELVAGYGQGRDLVNQLLGQIQMVRAISKFTDVVSLSKLKYIKENKLYRGAEGQKFTCQDGSEITDVGTWAGFCKALGVSASKIDEDISNLNAFGEEALEQLNAVGIGYRELRQYRKLPEDQKQALIEVAKTGDKEGFVELAEEIIAKHAKEREALQAKVDDATAELEAKDKVLASKADQINKLEAQTARKFKPREGSEARTLEEQTVLDELDASTAEAVLGLQRLFKAADKAMADGGLRESIQNRARQAVEFAAQQLAEIATEFGIEVNFEEMVRPTWLSEEALAAMEARQQKAN